MRSKTGGPNVAALLTIYLLGLLLGGLYVGMVTPVRTVVQDGFGIDSSVGIWMINIYSLFYAAFIPVIGKIADRRGRKRVFVICIAVFCVGAAICGLSAYFGGFGLLLFGRVVQALGACGMIPVANAELGTSIPQERRGMALGMAAAITGLANVLGSATGSAILGVFGTENWSMLFFVCLPIGLILMLASMVFLPNNKVENEGRLDYAGSALFVVTVLLMLYALRHIDFFNFVESFLSVSVLAPFAAALACVFVFFQVEKRASDPVFHLEYLHVRPIVITMLVSFFIGCIIISMTLIPEFAEVAMGNPIGSGGYYVIAIGVTSMFGAPMGGRFIDKFGAKPVLLFGLSVAAVGYLFLAFVATAYPSNPTIIAGLMVVGLGMGFAMGAPTNYMILENTDSSDSASAIGTITFIRQIGTTLAPAIFIGFTTGGYGMVGYSYMLVCIAAFALVGVLLMLFYKSPAKK